MKVLVVDDHPLIQHVMGALVQEVFQGPSILFAGTLAQALERATANTPINLAILDLRLPDSSGVGSITKFQHGVPEARVMVFSSTEDSCVITHAMDMGAAGYVPKTHPRNLIASALRQVAEGGTYVPPQALKRLDSDTRHQRFDRLTPRQAEVAQLISKGLCNKRIAEQLQIAEDTVKQHARAAYATLGVSSRVQLVNALIRSSIRE